MTLQTNHIPGVYTHHHPPLAGPVVIDSPHSGRVYPDDFKFICDNDDLRRAEDLLLDKILHGLPAIGCPVLLAEFPRSYLDVNRAANDIDNDMLETPWPHPLDPHGRSVSGIGLIRRLLKPGVPIYKENLSLDAISHRLEHYYHPYHAALSAMIDDTHRNHGCVLHLNMHSMSPRVFGESAALRAIHSQDIVIGDRHGTTCGRDLAERVMELFRAHGYRVGYNEPYKGAEIVKHYGHPAQQRHSLQIEINKSLYVFEKSLALKPGAQQVADHLMSIITQLQADLAGQFERIAAD
jgi:N-formylglutamate deformylase